MTLPVILRPPAEEDIREAHREFESIRPGLGERFVARVREALERIESMPRMHGVIWQDVRALRLKGFRHVLYYVVFTERVEVLAVMHGSRGAAPWKLRR